MGPEFCISDQAPDDTKAAVPLTKLWEARSRALQSCREATISAGCLRPQALLSSYWLFTAGGPCHITLVSNVWTGKVHEPNAGYRKCLALTSMRVLQGNTLNFLFYFYFFFLKKTLDYCRGQDRDISLHCATGEQETCMLGLSSQLQQSCGRGSGTVTDGRSGSASLSPLGSGPASSPLLPNLHPQMLLWPPTGQSMPSQGHRLLNSPCLHDSVQF